jgi:hypothetical protein
MQSFNTIRLALVPPPLDDVVAASVAASDPVAPPRAEQPSPFSHQVQIRLGIFVQLPWHVVFAAAVEMRVAAASPELTTMVVRISAKTTSNLCMESLLNP